MGKELDQKIKFDNAKWIYSSLEGNIRAADTKAAWIFSVLSVITGAMLTIISRLDLSMTNLNDNTMWLLIGGGAITIFSFKTIFSVIYPRLTKTTKDSKIYFGSIAKHTKEEYVRRSLRSNEKNSLEDLYSQIYILSKIVNSKYKSLRLAMISTSITLLYAIFTIMLI